MEVMETIKARRSVRTFKDEPIAKETLEDLVDAARLAPTARNVQPWEFIVITSSDTLKEIAGLAENGRFIAGAKACIAVFCSDTKYYLEDGCAATENILLMSASLGIASCWVAGDKKPYCNQVGSLLNVPSRFKLVSLIALGHPDVKIDLESMNKRSLDDVIHWEHF